MENESDEVMGDKSRIAWTQATINPVMGCSWISDGCTNCYAKNLIKRYKGLKGWPKKSNRLEFFPERLQKFSDWKRSRRIFVCSMSDLFHSDVPESFLDEVYAAMVQADHHTYQILTKRPERMLRYLESKSLPENIWHGVTVEGGETMWRLDLLKKMNSKVKFISFEPLISNPFPRKTPKFGTVFQGIDWVIVGAESGPGAREMGLSWAWDIVEEARECHCAIFIKQLGPIWAKVYGSASTKGELVEEWPEGLQIQEFPNVG